MTTIKIVPTHISFSYNEMWKFYRSSRIGTITSNVFACYYSANYIAMKYDKNKNMTPFLFRSMQAKVLPPDDSLSERHGTFIVYDAQLTEGARKQRRLYVVTPVLHHEERPERRSLLSADHFSFVVNAGTQAKPGEAQAKKLHFHRTRYSPKPYDIERGGVDHDPNHLPLEFDLPLSVEEFRGCLDNLRPLAPYIHDMLTRPYVSAAIPSDGGGRRKKKYYKMPDSNPTFDAIWRTLPVHNMLVIGVASVPMHYDVTVFVKDRLKHDDPSIMTQSFILRVPSAITKEGLEAAIAERFAGMGREDFE